MGKFARLAAALAVVCPLVAVANPVAVSALSPDIVISQVHGGGGNSGATYTNDFIELYNRGTAAVSVTGWSVQYASSTGTTWEATALSGTLQPGAYFLIQQAAGTGGTTPLPTPDVAGSTAMSAVAGKVALVNTTTALNGSGCPFAANVVDFVGYGSSTNCFEGTGPTATLSNTTAAIRSNNGCAETDNNTTDFSVGAPNPRNSASPAALCTTSTDPSGVGAANPGSVTAGNATLLTVAVAAGTNPASTGLAVTADLTQIGGVATQAFFDDGTNGDVTSGDLTFSWTATVAAATPVGAKSLPVSITDTQTRSGTATIPVTVQAPGSAANIVISQVYGGGGNSGATYTNDFIELYNRGPAAVSVTGWSVQYASSTGTTWEATALSGTLQPGQYYLVQQAQGSGGTTPLPTPDAIGNIPMSAVVGKVALVNSTTALTGSGCPFAASVVDFVGYGSAANCFEGSGPTPAPSNTNAAIRTGAGATDTNNNSADFVTGAPNPRNTSSGLPVNAPPTVDSGGPYSVPEGGSAGVAATGTDPEGGALTYAWDLDDNGTFETPGQSATFSVAGLDGPGSTTVKVRATDPGGLTAVSQAAVNITNVAPTVAPPTTSASPSTLGQAVTASATFTDPGPADGPFTCTVNYGAGGGQQGGTVVGNTCTGPSHAYTSVGPYTVTVSVTDKDGGVGSNSVTQSVQFDFDGFFSPIANQPTLNRIKSGQSVPVKFSLAGDQGLAIFAAGYPKSRSITCGTRAPTSSLQSIATAGSTGLTYDSASDTYTHVWNTSKAWAGTCRQLVVRFVDGTEYTADFSVK